MITNPANDKLTAISNLTVGDKVKLTNGNTVTFIRIKKKYFITAANGESYDTPIDMFDQYIERSTGEIKRFAELIESAQQKRKQNVGKTVKDFLKDQIEFWEWEIVDLTKQ